MNNMILIRGGKIAFSVFPGDFGDDGSYAFDLTELMTPYGLFIPISDAGMLAVPMLNPTRMLDFSDLPDTRPITTGDKGVLISEVPSGVQYSRVRIVSGKLAISPILTGSNGFAAISAYSHLKSMMLMCVRLTKTIEEAVQMYGKYAKAGIQNALIWDKQQSRQFLKDNWTEELDKALEAIGVK